MKKNRFILVLSIFSIAYSSYSRADATLCNNQEIKIFDCVAKNKKIVSICAKSGVDERYVEYRYGKKGKIEFSYKSENTSKNKIYRGTFVGGRVSTTLIWFDNGDYTYTLFSPDTGRDGVSVVRGDRLLATNFCVQKSTGDVALGTQLIEEKGEEDAGKMLGRIMQ